MPLPPLKLLLVGSQATSPAAPITGSPVVLGGVVLVGLGIGLAVKVGIEVTVGVTAGFLVAVAVAAAGGFVGGATVELAGAVGDTPTVETEV